MTTGDATKLKPCPFCAKPLTLSGRDVNPRGTCNDENCYGHRMPAVLLDDPRMVAAYNSRPSDPALRVLTETMSRIDRFIDAIAPGKPTKELASIQKEVRAALYGLQPTLPFEVALNWTLGDQLRASDSTCIDLWSALANVEWKNTTGDTVLYSFREAGALIAEIIGRGDYMDWYCSGPDATVSDVIATALKSKGWTHRILRNGARASGAAA